MPKIEKFSNYVDELMNENTRVKECVRQFDKSICKKANKTEIQYMREELDRVFITKDKWENFTQDYAQIGKRFDKENNKILGKFTSFRDDFILEVNDTCEELLSDKFIKYDKVCKDF